MEKEFALEVTAMLGAHDRLIRDLILAKCHASGNALDAIEAYAEKMREQPIFAPLPKATPAESDHVNQMISEMIDAALNAVRQEIMNELRLEHQRKRKQDE